MSYYNDDPNNKPQEEQLPENNEDSLTPLQRRLHQEDREREEHEAKKLAKQQKGGSKAGYFLSALSGVVIGVLLMWLLLPSLANQIPGNSNTSTSVSKNARSNISQTATVVTTDVTSAVEKASDAVVGISNYQVLQNNYGGFWFGQSFEEPSAEEGDLQEAGTGSGVIYKIEGNEAYVITNHHVIDAAERIEITMADGSKKEAELVGSDIWTDLAVIKVPADGIETVIDFGDSDVLKQGESVIAIGNPLGLDFYGSVTVGVISGTDRAVPVDLDGDGTEDWQSEVLQTDAAINGGNSGGALVNLNGDLIGINSMKIADEQVEGLGFAIPINAVIPIIEQLETNGQVKRPSMGITLMDLTDIPAFYQAQTLALPEGVTTGVVVGEVVRGSAADEAGMKQYDVIVEMDGDPIESSIDLRQHLYSKTAVGDTLQVKVYRAGKVMNVELVLRESSN